jgi:general L-amino acid transport system substrate-binding protein
MKARFLAAAAALATLLGATVAAAQAPPPAGQTLNTVRQRGQLVCGVSQGFAGFSAPDSRGEFRGLDVD